MFNILEKKVQEVSNRSSKKGFAEQNSKEEVAADPDLKPIFHANDSHTDEIMQIINALNMTKDHVIGKNKSDAGRSKNPSLNKKSSGRPKNSDDYPKAAADDLAAENDDVNDAPEGEEKENNAVNYSFHEDEFVAGLYKQAAIDYVKMFYGDEKRPSNLKDYGGYVSEESVRTDTHSETMEAMKAQKTMEKVVYAIKGGAAGSVNFEERKRLNTWIMFNKDLFAFYMAHSFTQDINYTEF